jgi:hypothetical protein
MLGTKIQKLMTGLLFIAMASLLAMIATCLEASRFDRLLSL